MFENATKVDISNIDVHLRQLWKELAAGGQKEEHALVRACALNLVIVVPDPRSAAELLNRVGTITDRHPNRCILIVAQRDRQEARMEAYVNTVCFGLGGGKRVCCQQIIVEASGERVAELHSTVYQLLVPDLPVYLWWAHVPPFGTRLFDRLVRVADRTLVNTDRFTREDFDRLLSLLTNANERSKWSDLNWTRLADWRLLLAQFYDVAEFSSHLMDIHRIEIDYEAPADDHFPARSLILVAWLAAQLGWSGQGPLVASGANRFQMQFGSGDRKIEVGIRATPGSSGNESILSVVFKTASGARFGVIRSADGALAETHVEIPGLEAIHRVGIKHGVSEEDLISHELEFGEQDPQYLRALGVLRELL